MLPIGKQLSKIERELAKFMPLWLKIKSTRYQNLPYALKTFSDVIHSDFFKLNYVFVAWEF
jgi:hypothetical protein